MSVGTYFFIVDDLEYSFYGELQFEEEDNKYTYARRVQCDGTIKDTGYALLIDGIEPLSGLKCSVTIEEAEPWILSDAPGRQTRRIEAFPRPAFISKIIGNIGYEKGLQERRLQRGLYASVCLNETAFEDIWNCVLAGRQLRSLQFDIFGSAMVQVETSYHWRIGKEDKDLLICGFGFRAR